MNTVKFTLLFFYLGVHTYQAGFYKLCVYLTPATEIQRSYPMLCLLIINQLYHQEIGLILFETIGLMMRKRRHIRLGSAIVEYSKLRIHAAWRGFGGVTSV